MDENLSDIDTQTLGDMMFERRREMVEIAEDAGQFDVFEDKQSIGSMRQSIEDIEDNTLRSALEQRFAEFEQIYNEYTARVVGEATRELEQ